MISGVIAARGVMGGGGGAWRALAGFLALALAMAPAPGRGADLYIPNNTGNITAGENVTCADVCGENGQNCSPGSVVQVDGVWCTGGGADGKKSTHCTEESLAVEHDTSTGETPSSFSFKSLGCECATKHGIAYLSCPSGADASNGDIGKAADFRHAKLNDMKFNGANLGGARFEHANCKGCSFVGAKMRDADMSYAKMGGSDFSQANLEAADLGYMMANGANFTAANLEEAHAEYAHFNGGSFIGASMSDFDSDYGHFNRADLSGAVLTGASLNFAMLKGVDFSGAQLDDADLRYANLKRAVSFESAMCSNADFSFMTCPSGKSVGVFQDRCDPSESCAD